MPAVTPTYAQKSGLPKLIGDSRGRRLAEDPLRPDEQHRDQHAERDDLLPYGAQPAAERAPRRELHGNAEQEPAGQRAVRAADAAEDDRREDGQQQDEAHVRVERAL